MRNTVGEEPLNQVADRVGISPSTIGNWVKGENFAQPSANTVLAFARAFHCKVPDAMVAAGYGETPDYDGTVLTRPDPSALSTDELLDELRRRAESHPKASARDRATPLRTSFKRDARARRSLGG